MSENSIFDFENMELPGADENAPKPEFIIGQHTQNADTSP